MVAGVVRLMCGARIPGRRADQLKFSSFWEDESGQAASEYVLIIGLISIPIYLAFKILFVRVLNAFISSVISSFTRG